MKLRQLLSLSAAVVLFSACGAGLEESQSSEQEGAPALEEGGEVSAFACPPSYTECTAWEYQYDTGCGAVYTRTCRTYSYNISTGCSESVRTTTQQQCR